MKRKFWIRIAALAPLLAALLWAFWPRGHDEPIYQGRTLSWWTSELVNRPDPFNYRPPEAAVQAIKAIGPKAVPFLLEWLPKPSPPMSSLRRQLSRIPFIGVIFSNHRRARSSQPQQDAVVEAFRVLGPEAKPALPYLAKLLTVPPKSMDDYDSYTTIVQIIPSLGPAALPVMLITATNLQGSHEQWELVKGFGSLGSNAAPAIPALVAWTYDTNYWVRFGAVTALGEIGQQPEIVVPALRTALGDTNQLVKRGACEAIGTFGPSVIPDLIKKLDDPDNQVRGGALSGLGKVVAAEPDLVLPILEGALRENNNFNQRSAAYALGFSGYPPALQALARATNVPGISDIVYQFSEARRVEGSPK